MPIIIRIVEYNIRTLSANSSKSDGRRVSWDSDCGGGIPSRIVPIITYYMDIHEVSVLTTSGPGPGKRKYVF
jgi:hypothetical protein